MRNRIITILYLCVTILASCNANEKKMVLKSSESTRMNVESYTGNAFIFFDPDNYGAKCFIIPDKEEDSVVFKCLDVNDAIIGKKTIQVDFGRPDLLKLVNYKKREVLVNKICSLPKDSMFFLRAFISYKNCKEFIFYGKSINVHDSCESKLIMYTDSAKFYFKIYH